MSHEEENIINIIFPENLNKLLAKKPINKDEIKKIKEKIRQRLKNPQFSIKTSKLAELFVIYLINIKRIQNQEDLDTFIEKSGFLHKYCIIRDFDRHKEKL